MDRSIKRRNVTSTSPQTFLEGAGHKHTIFRRSQKGICKERWRYGYQSHFDHSTWMWFIGRLWRGFINTFYRDIMSVLWCPFPKAVRDTGIQEYLRSSWPPRYWAHNTSVRVVMAWLKFQRYHKNTCGGHLAALWIHAEARRFSSCTLIEHVILVLIWNSKQPEQGRHGSVKRDVHKPYWSERTWTREKNYSVFSRSVQRLTFCRKKHASCLYAWGRGLN